MSEQSSEIDLPRVMVASATIEKSRELAKSIGGKFVPEGSGTEYVLNIDNKYYSTQILLCPMEHTVISSGYEAIILHDELQTEDAVKGLNRWLSPHITEAEVQLLVCDSVPNSLVRTKAIEWCSCTRFELVEINQTDFSDVDDCDLGNSKFGIERIVEALEAHTWPNMTLKVTNNDVYGVGQRLENVQLGDRSNLVERLQMESVLDRIMDIENADFGELYSQLRTMREHTVSLPSDQLKVAAEQLITAFWKAMGGDLSEVEDPDE